MKSVGFACAAARRSAKYAAPAGATLFYASDALIAWNKFVREHGWGRLAIIVTYHVGQILLVLSLI